MQNDRMEGDRVETARSTPAAEVAAVVGWLASTGATYQVNGGWAVDALVGRQTREHGDVDLFVDAERVPQLLDWLQRRGYRTVEDWLPVRLELASATGRVDVHPMEVQPNGDGIQRGLDDAVFRHPAAQRSLGRVGGHSVVVASAERLRELRSGYPPRPRDVHDLALLDQLLAGHA